MKNKTWHIIFQVGWMHGITSAIAGILRTSTAWATSPAAVLRGVGGPRSSSSSPSRSAGEMASTSGWPAQPHEWQLAGLPAPPQWYHSLPKLCIITLNKLCIIIMPMHNPSHFCIITISPFLALGAQSEIERPSEAVRFAKTAPPARLCKHYAQ